MLKNPTRKQIDKNNYELITDLKRLDEWCNLASEKGVVSIDCETTSTNPVEAEIVGFSMSFENSKACYIPLKHEERKSEQVDSMNLFQKLKLF